MKPIFTKAPSLSIRLVLAIFVSLALILSDGQNHGMIKFRSC